MSLTSSPPRFVPTLTDVVVRPAFEHAAPASSAAQVAPPQLIEEQLVERIMQRVDLVLERRLREAMGRIILEHTQALAPKLRLEIEGVVRESIAQALLHESGLR